MLALVCLVMVSLQHEHMSQIGVRAYLDYIFGRHYYMVELVLYSDKTHYPRIK
jgi:hypothetical protein